MKLGAAVAGVMVVIVGNAWAAGEAKKATTTTGTGQQAAEQAEESTEIKWQHGLSTNGTAVKADAKTKQVDTAQQKKSTATGSSKWQVGISKEQLSQPQTESTKSVSANPSAAPAAANKASSNGPQPPKPLKSLESKRQTATPHADAAAQTAKAATQLATQAQTTSVSSSSNAAQHSLSMPEQPSGQVEKK